MPTDTRKTLGRLGERLAVEHFERLGWEIVERNFQTRHGEIDLIALDGETLVFAEVKTCRLGRHRPWDNLHERKQSQVRRLVGVWFSGQQPRPRFARIRCDAIGIVVDERDQLLRLDHLEDAF
jgi:putative endonuclease